MHPHLVWEQKPQTIVHKRDPGVAEGRKDKGPCNFLFRLGPAGKVLSTATVGREQKRKKVERNGQGSGLCVFISRAKTRDGAIEKKRWRGCMKHIFVFRKRYRMVNTSHLDPRLPNNQGKATFRRGMAHSFDRDSDSTRQKRGLRDRALWAGRIRLH